MFIFIKSGCTYVKHPTMIKVKVRTIAILYYVLELTEPGSPISGFSVVCTVQRREM